MRELGYHRCRDGARPRNKEPMQARLHAPLYDVEAPYVAEMARLEVRQRFGAAAESAGYKVYTTIDGRLQAAANRALRIGLIEYDRRHGWRGPVGHVELAANANPDAARGAGRRIRLGRRSAPGGRRRRSPRRARASTSKAAASRQIDWDGLSWARKAGSSETRSGRLRRAPARSSRRGDVVYVVIGDGTGDAQLGQMPEAQSALVALDPDDGGIAALVGGFDYFTNKYNRVTQAQRLPGSGFKPFLYSAALENGFTPASVLLDAPFVLEGEGIESSWRPENSQRRVSADRRGCAKRWCTRATWSRSACCARWARPTRSTTSRASASTSATLPQNLTLALGTVQATPLEMATGYAVFANGGFRVHAVLHRSHRECARARWSGSAKPQHRLRAVRAAGRSAPTCR